MRGQRGERIGAWSVYKAPVIYPLCLGERLLMDLALAYVKVDHCL